MLNNCSIEIDMARPSFESCGWVHHILWPPPTIHKEPIKAAFESAALFENTQQEVQ